MLLLLLFACKPRRRLAWTIGSCNICAAFKELSRTLPAKFVWHRKVCLLATSWQFHVKVAFTFHLTPYSQYVFLQLPESMQRILMRARFDSTARIKLFDLFTEARTQGNSTSNQTPTRTHTVYTRTPTWPQITLPHALLSPESNYVIFMSSPKVCKYLLCTNI